MIESKRIVVLAVACVMCACAPNASDSRDDDDDPSDLSDPSAPDPSEPTLDILEELNAIDGFFAVEVPVEVLAGTRRFNLTVTQPVRHDEPLGATFTQRAILLHVDTAAPMVLATTGYDLFAGIDEYQEELTILLGANQLFVEERYFGDSTPNSSDWTPLTIQNAAADHHRIVAALKPLYPTAWIATGHSKGGMTSVFHKRFYPNDVDGVVAYVAPISFAAPDIRYRAWTSQLGDPACSDALRTRQSEAAALLPDIVDALQANGSPLSRAVLSNFAMYLIGSYEWSYWQYLGACDATLTGGSIATVQDAIERFGIDPDGQFGALSAYDAYTYQSRHQLGFPDLISPHLDTVFAAFDPRLLDDVYGPGRWGVAPTFDDGAAMGDVQQWVQNEADDIVFIYGGYDPWSGGQYNVDNAIGANIHKFIAPRVSHGLFMGDLLPADLAIVRDTLTLWTGAAQPPPFARVGDRLARTRTLQRVFAQRLWRLRLP